ncbi:hypothetical protein Dda3937_04397 [Dickeya dadantii 3937]|uniref:Uncharacterized protein n=1 Tax=Dickeya dadantii (strain 3937) TaxID=198628 RepID=E0SEJ2_DICD3|nr:hypothetical protein Dda3937_04397 [Dickeya dadantii 3937]
MPATSPTRRLSKVYFFLSNTKMTVTVPTTLTVLWFLQVESRLSVLSIFIPVSVKVNSQNILPLDERERKYRNAT